MTEITKFVCFTAENLELAIAPDRSVVVCLKGEEKTLGLAPGIGMMLNFSATEARLFAQALVRTADKAEDGLPRA